MFFIYAISYILTTFFFFTSVFKQDNDYYKWKVFLYIFSLELFVLLWGTLGEQIATPQIGPTDRCRYLSGYQCDCCLLYRMQETPGQAHSRSLWGRGSRSRVSLPSGPYSSPCWPTHWPLRPYRTPGDKLWFWTTSSNLPLLLWWGIITLLSLSPLLVLLSMIWQSLTHTYIWFDISLFPLSLSLSLSHSNFHNYALLH